jgi:hypothetical protein
LYALDRRHAVRGGAESAEGETALLGSLLDVVDRGERLIGRQMLDNHRGVFTSRAPWFRPSLRMSQVLMRQLEVEHV